MIKNKHKGAANELIACTWLLGQGYEVFRNIFQHGIVDIIAIKDDKTSYFDVKGGCFRVDGSVNRRFVAHDAPTGLQLLYILPDGSCMVDESPTVRGTLQKECALCGKPFKARKKHQVYCSNDCRIDSWRVKYGDKR